MTPLPPPPAYSLSRASSTRRKASLSTLPDHLAVAILSRLSIIDLALRVRRTSRHLYLLTMGVLRPLLEPAYRSKVLKGHSSDPLGLALSSVSYLSSSSPLAIRARETQVLDLFIASCVDEAVKSSASELYLLPSEDVERELFEFQQPRARVEDLVILLGGKADEVLPLGWVTGTDPEGQKRTACVRAEDVKVALKLRSAGLALPVPGASGRAASKNVVEVERAKGDTLDSLAKRLVMGLKGLEIYKNGDGPGYLLTETR